MQYYPTQDDFAQLRKLYVRHAPHVKEVYGLDQKIQAAVRNARSHIAGLARSTLVTSLPNERAEDGTIKVCVCVRLRASVYVCQCCDLCGVPSAIHILCLGLLDFRLLMLHCTGFECGGCCCAHDLPRRGA